jgi:cytochrome c-type biogenesis protein CcmH
VAAEPVVGVPTNPAAGEPSAPSAGAPSAPAAGEPTAPTAGAPAGAEAPAAPSAGTPAGAEAPATGTAGAAPTSAAIAVDPSAIIGDPAGPPVSGDELRKRTLAAARLLRCPVCQGLSVADSPSESAQAIKQEVQDLVARGYDTEQVLVYFEASYGEFIRLEPTTEGVNVLVWVLPIALIVGGLGWIGWSVARSKRRTSASPTASPASPGADPAPPAARAPAGPPPAAPAGPPPAAPAGDPALNDYLRRVREETR